MTSKERVRKTLRHQEPDRVPVGEWGVDYDIVERLLGHQTYWRARQRTTRALWDGKRTQVVDSFKRDLVAMIRAFDHDLVPVHLLPPADLEPQKIERPDNDTYVDGHRRVRADRHAHRHIRHHRLHATDYQRPE